MAKKAENKSKKNIVKSSKKSINNNDEKYHIDMTFEEALKHIIKKKK